jgi:hypothetical protein
MGLASHVVHVLKTVFGLPDRERQLGDLSPGMDGRRSENVREGCCCLCSSGLVLALEADFLSFDGFLQGRCVCCARACFSLSNSRCQISSLRSATGAGCARRLCMEGAAEGGKSGDMGAEEMEGTYECLRSGLPAISSLIASSWCTAVLNRFQK